MVIRSWLIIIYIAFMGFILSACTQPEVVPATIYPPPDPRLTPFILKPSPTLTGIPTQVPLKVTATDVPKPSSTPVTYKIIKGDTLLGLAFRFGVTLDELLSANPNVDPQFLVVGTDLIIPVIGQVQDNKSTDVPTPVPLAAESDPTCYPQIFKDLWCFWEVRNHSTNIVGNITGTIRLFDNSGDLIETQSVIAPINYLFPGEVVPFAAFFHLSDSKYRAQGAVNSAFQISQDKLLYVPVKVNPEIVILEGGSALASGIAVAENLKNTQTGIFETRVVAIAYDQLDAVIGLRQNVYEINDPSILFEGWSFKIQVFSTGREISRVNVIVEVIQKTIN